MDLSVYKFRTKAACRIAEVDLNSFNDAIAKNIYPCAPATFAGSPRLFDLDDMVALYLFSKLQRLLMTREGAGAIACNLRSQMKTAELLSRNVTDDLSEGVRIDFVDTGWGSFDAVIAKRGDPIPTMHNDCRVLSCWSHDVDHLRAYVHRRAQEELTTIGEE